MSKVGPAGAFESDFPSAIPAHRWHSGRVETPDKTPV